ncbi:hypothetical protein ACFLU4_07210, partial [Chloroflexota bacterium]
EKLKPAKEEVPYHWRVRATDGASNKSDWTGAGTFFVGTAFALPGWGINALWGIGLVLFAIIGFWMGRRTMRY